MTREEVLDLVRKVADREALEDRGLFIHACDCKLCRSEVYVRHKAEIEKRWKEEEGEEDE